MSYTSIRRGASQAFYQLVKTRSVNEKENSLYNNVYSLLRLEYNGDIIESCFLYDISRTESTALSILERIKEIAPSSTALQDCIEELL